MYIGGQENSIRERNRQLLQRMELVQSQNSELQSKASQAEQALQELHKLNDEQRRNLTVLQTNKDDEVL